MYQPMKQPRPLTRPALMVLTASFILIFTLLWRTFAGVGVVQDKQPAPARPSAAVTIGRLQNKLHQNPDSASAYAQLGLAYLQRVRETGDSTYYALAEESLNKATARDPQQLEAVIGQGLLALARHDFATALAWGGQARALNPYSAEALGILVDANGELGRYGQAVNVAQKMVDLRPNLASYSRVSYVRELYGDVDGAIEAMQKAADAGVPGQENTLWAQVQLGNLYFNHGDWDQAEKIYQQALYFQPDYAYALAGVGQVQAARGSYEAAMATYQPLVERFPTAAFVITLGELYEATGQLPEASQQYDLVRLIQELNASAGMDVDLELALFDADHGRDPEQTVANAQAAYGRRPSIHAADALAWALYQNGEYERAWQYSQEALRLGTQDALFHFHAGMIAHALGRETAARHHLQEALSINPAFSIRYAAQAQALLAQINS